MKHSALDDFAQAYVAAALWSSTYGENGEHAMDDGEHELAPETRDRMAWDCREFWEANEHLITPDNCDSAYGCAAQAGHDFWLTRCGHGSGFWDGDWQEPAAAALTDASKAFGNVDLYVGDDGLIHAF